MKSLGVSTEQAIYTQVTKSDTNGEARQKAGMKQFKYSPMEYGDIKTFVNYMGEDR